MNLQGRLSNELEAQVGAHHVCFLMHGFSYRASRDTAPNGIFCWLTHPCRLFSVI